MADEVRFGIVGLGVGRSRAKMALEARGARLVCVCDLQEEKVRAFAGEAGCDWTTSLDDLLARKDIDAVGIFTPSGTHCDLAVRAIRAGKHTFTTKPMDIRVEKCDAAIQAAREKGVVLAVDFGNRYVKLNQQVKKALDEGRLGRVFLGDVRLKWHREQSYYDGGYPPGWRSRKDTEGGSIANQGVHYVDLIYWFLGPVKEVYGRIGTLGHRIATEDVCIAHLTFESGAWGLIETTTSNTPDLGTTVEISGTEGSLVWKDRGIELFQTRTEERVEVEKIDAPEGPRNIIEDMVSAITKGTRPAVPGEEGRRSVEIFTAVYRSAETGRPVALDQR
jgi:predicted dehydrogenase